MEKTYTDSFYGLMESKIDSCKRAVKYIFDLFHPASIVDFGCGTGEWLSLFKECGTSAVRGYDGDYVNKELLAISKDEFVPWDLTKKIPVDRQYDMAISLEVAEHLAEEYADSFVANITSFSDIVLFSAAIPGQGGDGHVNEQWPSYWKEKFEANGFVCCDCLREYFWNIEELDYYYKQNVVLYVRSSKQEIIRKLSGIKKNILLDIVHPIAYLKYKANLDALTLLMNDIPGGGISRSIFVRKKFRDCLYMEQAG